MLFGLALPVRALRLSRFGSFSGPSCKMEKMSAIRLRKTLAASLTTSSSFSFSRSVMSSSVCSVCFRICAAETSSRLSEAFWSSDRTSLPVELWNERTDCWSRKATSSSRTPVSFRNLSRAVFVDCSICSSYFVSEVSASASIFWTWCSAPAHACSPNSARRREWPRCAARSPRQTWQ